MNARGPIVADLIRGHRVKERKLTETLFRKKKV